MEVIENAVQVVSWQRGLIVEVDVLEHPRELLWVGAADFAQRIIQCFALCLLVGAADVVKEVPGRDDDAVVHGGIGLDDLDRRISGDAGEIILESVGALLVEAIGGTLEEQQRQDVVLLVRDLVAEQVRALPEVILEGLECERLFRIGGHRSRVRRP